MFLSANKRANENYQSIYKDWEYSYNCGDIKKAQINTYKVIDYLESRGNACRLAIYIEVLEEKRFLPDEIESFRNKMHFIQGKEAFESNGHDQSSFPVFKELLVTLDEIYLRNNGHQDSGERIRCSERLRIFLPPQSKIMTSNIQQDLQGYTDTGLLIYFLQNCSLILARFGLNSDTINFLLHYVRLMKSKVLATSIVDNQNIENSFFKKLDPSLMKAIQEEMDQYEKKVDEHPPASATSNRSIEELIHQISQYVAVPSKKAEFKVEEENLQQDLFKFLDLPNDRDVSDIVIMSLMMHLFDCAYFFSEKIECHILRHYLQATIIFEKRNYQDCIKFIDSFFKKSVLTKKERSPLVYLQARSYEKLGHQSEALRRYSFLQEQKM